MSEPHFSGDMGELFDGRRGGRMHSHTKGRSGYCSLVFRGFTEERQVGSISIIDTDNTRVPDAIPTSDGTGIPVFWLSVWGGGGQHLLG